MKIPPQRMPVPTSPVLMAVRKALPKEFSTTPPFGLPIGLTMVSTDNDQQADQENRRNEFPDIVHDAGLTAGEQERDAEEDQQKCPFYGCGLNRREDAAEPDFVSDAAASGIVPKTTPRIATAMKARCSFA